MNEKELELLKQMSERMAGAVTLTLTVTGDERSDAFRRFGDLLTEHAHKVHLLVKSSDDEGPPFFGMGRKWRFHAVPEGTELGPFLEILLSMSGVEPAMDAALKERAHGLVGIHELKLFVSAQCTFCPAAIGRLIPFMHVQQGCEAVVVDCMLFPEMAAEDGVMAVPTCIVNGEHRLTGDVKLTEILDRLESSEPELFGTSVYRRMIKEGQASGLAAMMIGRGKIFPAFVPLLTDAEWSVRLGAMVVMEELAESAQVLARGVLPQLWDELPEHDSSLQGDILYLIGMVGDGSWLPRLQSMGEAGVDDELAVVLEESVQQLKQRLE